MCKPGDAGQVGDEPPQVVRSYSVVVAAGREGQDGAAASVSATCKHTQPQDGWRGGKYHFIPDEHDTGLHRLLLYWSRFILRSLSFALVKR